MKIPIIGKPLEFTLKISGLWPDYFNILGVVLVLSPLFTMLPFQVWDSIKEFDNTFIMLDTLSHILVEILLYGKFLAICYHSRLCQSLFRELAEDYENEIKIEDWSEIISASHRFSKLDYTVYAGAGSLYYVQFVILYPITPAENRELILRAYYPFDFKSSPMFEFMTAIQVLQIMVLCIIQAVSECLLVALVLHVCGHIDLLTQKIDEFSVSCINTRKNVSLAPVIKQHLKVLNIVDKLETIYTYASFVQVFLSTFIICTAGFIVLVVTDDIMISIKYVMLCLTVSWQGYSFCFSGQRLINKGEEILNKIYDTFWYDANPKDVLALSYMITKAQKPLLLTAGKFTSLSAQTFTSIIKTSFSYISVLRASSI